MRLLHTSDWHAGRQLARQTLDEGLFHCLDAMEEFVVQERVDAVLVAGDIFDSSRPSGACQERVYGFFLRLLKEGVPAVLVAGNHDSYGHWSALSRLLTLANVYVAPKPSLDTVFTLPTRSGPLQVAGLAWPSERLLAPLVASDQRGADAHRQHWARQVESVLGILASRLQGEGPKVLVGHLFLNGSTPAGSERAMSITELCAVPGEVIPREFQYAALGHVHRHQPAAAAARTCYSGAPRLLDFGEAGEKRGFVRVDLDGFADYEFLEIPPRQPLHTVECTLEQLESVAQEYGSRPGFLKLVVRLSSPEVALADHVRRLLPQTLIVQARRTVSEGEGGERRSREALLVPRDTFRDYYAARHGEQAPEPLMQAFDEVYEEVADAAAQD